MEISTNVIKYTNSFQIQYKFYWPSFLIITLNSTSHLPIAVDHQWAFNFWTFSINCGNVIFVHGFAITKIAYTDAFLNNVLRLFFCQVVSGSILLQLMTEKQDEHLIVFDPNLKSRSGIFIKFFNCHNQWGVDPIIHTSLGMTVENAWTDTIYVGYYAVFSTNFRKAISKSQNGVDSLWHREPTPSIHFSNEKVPAAWGRLLLCTAKIGGMAWPWLP